MDIVKAVKTASLPVRRIATKHDSLILTAVNMGAVLATAYFALKEGPKAKEILDAKRAEGASNLEKGKAVAFSCKKTMMAMAVAWGSAILNKKITGEKIATLSEALLLYKSLSDDTKKATEEVVGKEKAEEIEKAVTRKRVMDRPVVLSEVESTGHGQYIFREPMTGKTFRASKDYIELVVSKYSEELGRHFKGIHGDPEYRSYADEDFEVSMTDIFSDIGLSHCGFADLFVWRAIDCDGIQLNLNNTFEYEGPDGTLEPGYILDFYSKPILAYSSYSSPYGRGY